MKWRSRGLALSAGLAAIVLIAGGAGLASTRGWTVDETAAPASASIAAVLAPLAGEIRARGELEAVNAYPIAVPLVQTGALKVAWLVDEGSEVSEGDTLVEFDASQLEIELDNNVATLRSTQRQIDRNRIQSQIESGSIGVFRSVAELELETAEAVKIYDESIFSRREILDASLDRGYAEKKIVFADLSLLLRGKFYDIDVGILDVQRRSVSDKVDRVKSSLGKLVLKSPADGMVVYKKNWRGGTVSVGSSVWPGNVLMQLVDPSETALKVFVPEKYAAGLAEGLTATVRIDAFPEREYSGSVKSASKLSRPIREGLPMKYFEAVVTLDEADPSRLKPGMEGEARIAMAGTDEDSLIVPRAAIRGAGDATWVIVETADGALEPREVGLGAGDLVRVAVESGLQEGDRVLIGETPPGLDPPASEEAEQEARSG